jgi:hypothetical protein
MEAEIVEQIKETSNAVHAKKQSGALNSTKKAAKNAIPHSMQI